MTPQTLWVDERATGYEAFCRTCTSDLAEGRIFSLAARTARVAGTLSPDAAAALATCGRGHLVVVRRRRAQPLARAS